MSESTRDLLIRGTAAARAGEAKEARFFLEWLLGLDADIDQKIEAWYWLAKLCDDPAEKRNYLENVLANRPFHLLARKELMILDGKLDPTEMIDPNQGIIQIKPGQDPETINFTCPQCGGRMVYTPDGSSLTCEYCEVRRTKENGNQAASQDFLISMATAKGHATLAGILTGSCPGCGAEFILPGESISMNCPYCDAVFVTNQLETHEQTAPAIIYPARVSRLAAEAILRNWLISKDIETPTASYQFNGIYLPVWSFSMGGELGYRYVIEDKENHRSESFSGSRTVLRGDILIPASHKFEDEAAFMIRSISRVEMSDYSPDYLADWTAESYTISVSDASLDARTAAIAMEKQAIEFTIPAQASDLTLDSHDLTVESYQLGLIPIWLAASKNPDNNEQYLIDALHGVILEADKRALGLKSIWQWIKGDH